MDMKGQLLTQVPSQTDVGIKNDSSQIGIRIECDECEEATIDPSSISNGCWDQKLAHVAAWCGGVLAALSSYWCSYNMMYVYYGRRHRVLREPGVKISGFESRDTPLNFDSGIKTEVDLLLVTS
eukprot:scaffold16103_cov62-Attheya_sp.AAC.1